MIDRTIPDWYKDAVIYQLHIKAFFDADNDGIGDFEGLIQKLDYVKSLGVTAVWLLPFYPSPLRDDGYDIAEYREVNPSYGTMRDFRRLVRECHRRDLRVITELVINHTSDQHPWFQRARRAKKGSAWRDFYVWRDTDDHYTDTRIIFIDSEASNWTWDPVAGQYYWHRFYHHQPDLNFDNPKVLQAILGVLHFWLKAGVDGLRLDAVPYLIEREGTNNENLPETHEVLRKIRAEIDAHYPDRMLLAEANQWPEDTAEYFGQGDECHMAFHFPLMPRMYMALAMEDRHPITDILRQTPEVPDGCQWAVFLRNHDELTLEMVTDDERDYLWEVYATEKRMRINLGIRRRLAPLMERDRRKIELMEGLLLSMPGTPVLYYGDEIGMGDNVFLGDRDGVRTPMQWTLDRNGGFSRAHPQRLYLPTIQDPLYGYQAINVESQEADSSSLLNWTRRMLQVRSEFSAFGRGTLEFLYPGNRKIFAYLRQHEDHTVLCVVNLSRTAQAVELDLARFAGRVPIELSGRTAFPPIGELPYLLTLPAYGFLWFELLDRAHAPDWHQDHPEPMPGFLTLVLRKSLEEITAGQNRKMLETEILPDYLPKHRWFAGKDQRIDEISLDHTVALPGEASDPWLLLVLGVRQGKTTTRYQLPVSVAWDERALRPGSARLAWTLAKTRRFRHVGALQDATMDDNFARSVLAAMQHGDGGEFRAQAWEPLSELPLDETTEVRRFGVEQSNTSMIVGDRVALKIFRKLAAGTHPELEMARYLTHEAGFANTPALLGSLELQEASGEQTLMAIAQAYLFNQGDGWRVMTDYLDRELDRRALARDSEPDEHGGEFDHEQNLALVERLGQRTAEMHRALARPTEISAFTPENVSEADLARWAERAAQQAREGFASLRRVRDGLEGATAERADEVLASEDEVLARIDAAGGVTPGMLKTRLHGDLHLGQVLVVERDFHFIDFEGEPARSLAERREKSSALRDVAGMARSFDYAAYSAAYKNIGRQPANDDAVLEDALAWRDAALARFFSAYREHLGDCRSWPEREADARCLLDAFLLEKACYELAYEAANRPHWLDIPLAGIRALIAETPASKGASRS
ncbi:maltose alpha-D-glucosyltransferase [Wenzhouxiangella sp. XN24]|uniref:maltose alpha-D-glucosyltransferase n=1 Tax=Wenzhouxiangella sp. XN24 TaxID=2713569 RepID=UPI0013EC4FEA|nr:maltose alpha-D-glucosyltransferase [Wenzhouxiangella sp. XN24]NGX15635.1 maltose alpha-D-glucosyltransferase [Wenzhouxiangella sp. XN24]